MSKHKKAQKQDQSTSHQKNHKRGKVDKMPKRRQQDDLEASHRAATIVCDLQTYVSAAIDLNEMALQNLESRPSRALTISIANSLLFEKCDDLLNQLEQVESHLQLKQVV